MKQLYVGTMNDAIFIIDGPPRPAGDPVISEHGPNVIAKMASNDREASTIAEKMVAAYNATL
jgi:hypothetical protein